MHGGLAHMCFVCGSRIKIRVWLIYFMWAVLRFGQDAWLCLCFEMNTMCVQAIVFRAVRDAFFFKYKRFSEGPIPILCTRIKTKPFF